MAHLPPQQLEKSWQAVLQDEWAKPYLLTLATFLAEERRGEAAIYPSKEEVFSAFTLPFDKVNVVIIGQDPYHGPNQAHGLSFSVKKGIPHPPSLKNIFKELKEDLGIPIPSHGCLQSWKEQGVLMLNAVLTVRGNQPRSHARKGWETFTDSVVGALALRKDPVIFVLWGNDAKAKCQLIKNTHHFVLEAAHPSPYSAHSGFFGCRHFSKINELIKKQGKAPINWEIV